MTQLTVDQIHKRALAGDGDAQFTLARLFDREGKHDVAVGWLQKAAAAGHAMSANYLGVRFMSGQAAPFDPAAGARLTFQAAEAGNGEACARAAVLNAVGLGRPADWRKALEWLRRAAKARHPGAPDQLEVLKAEAEFLGQTGPLDLDSLIAPLSHQTMVESPRIWVLEKFCSPQVCAWIRGRTQGRLQAARTYDAEQGGRSVNDMRTNTGAGFGLWNSDLVLTLTRFRIAEATQVTFSNLEPVNVLHYDPGQKFDRHFDWIDPDVGHFADDLAQRGQRTATALVYLNDAYEGGDTDFPEIGYGFKGDTGDLLVFFNVTEDGKPDPRTLHAGTPPTSGEKWVLSQWIRDRAQPVI
jgi:hypothetical protein